MNDFDCSAYCANFRALTCFNLIEELFSTHKARFPPAVVECDADLMALLLLQAKLNVKHAGCLMHGQPNVKLFTKHESTTILCNDIKRCLFSLMAPLAARKFL